MNQRADLSIEYELRDQGYTRVAGLDEAGRGAWAGPVVAGAVILPLDQFDLAHVLDGVNDSKLLSAHLREVLLPRIIETALATAIGHATNEEIDELGIVAATRLAMKRALDALTVEPSVLLIDALELPAISLPTIALPKGDQKSLSIAAASIVAKVTRDQFMEQLDVAFPKYGFREHKGYGTSLHRQSLRRFGPTAIHRLTFAPVKALASPAAKENDT
jgi:ribonuclease HII